MGYKPVKIPVINDLVPWISERHESRIQRFVRPNSRHDLTHRVNGAVKLRAVKGGEGSN